MIRILAALLALIVASQPTGDDRRSVEIDAIVESANRTRLSLDRSDFEIVVDGRLHPIDKVSAVDESVTILLLVDVSWSATRGNWQGVIGHGHNFPELVRAIERSFVPQLKPGDRLRVGRFGRRLVLGDGYTSDRRAMLASVRTMLSLDAVEPQERSGPSPLWDVTAEAADGLASEGGRRAILLLTDGWASGNVRSVVEAGKEAASGNVSVHTILAESRGRGPDLAVAPDKLLRQLAALTGGLFRLDDRLTPEDALPFPDILQALHRIYRIQFAVEGAPDRVRQIDVRVKRPDVRAHARKWFVAP
jgi:hypothetical protein